MIFYRMEIRKTINELKNLRYMLVLEGIGAGIAAGFMVSFFRLSISWMEELRGIVLDTPLMAAAFFAVLWAAVCLCLKFEKNVAGSGIPHVKGELSGQIETVWWKILISKIIGGACAIGAGLSVGREGPSVQIGAMCGKGFSRLLKRPATEERILLTAGAGAGLAAAFNAPLAGAIFSLEEIHKNLSAEVLIAALSAAISSDFISSYVFGLSPVFSVSPEGLIPLGKYWLILLFGIVLGLSGFIYSKSIKYIQKAYNLIPWMPVKIGIAVAAAAILAYTYPSVLGGGNSLVDELAASAPVLASLALLLIVKFVFSMISFGSGTPGGIFLPLLVLGAVQGGLFSSLFTGGDYLENFIILGMAGYFTAIVKSPVTGIILISEMTGSLSHLLSLALVCLAAYMTSELLKSKPIYDQLLEVILAKEGKLPRKKKRKVMLDSYIQAGSLIDGKTVEALQLPAGVLIISIDRNGTEIIPHGKTILTADDDLLILCDESLIYETEKILTDKCRKVT